MAQEIPTKKEITEEHRRKLSVGLKRMWERRATYRTATRLCLWCHEPLPKNRTTNKRHRKCFDAFKASTAKGRKRGNCVDCGHQLSDTYRVYCRSCSYKGERNYTYVDGRNYRVRKMGAEGSHSQQEWEQLKEKYNYMCLCCKQQSPFIELTKDHIVPLSMGGSDYISNIQPLCRSCNARKKTKTISYLPNENVI